MSNELSVIAVRREHCTYAPDRSVLGELSIMLPTRTRGHIPVMCAAINTAVDNTSVVALSLEDGIEGTGGPTGAAAKVT